MTVLEVIQRSTDFLTRKGIESPRLQVELLLAHILGVPRLKLYLDFERKLSDAQLDEMRERVRRRAQHEPLQHILGTVSFCGLELLVNRDVLVPRPETEELAERAWQFLANRARTESGLVRALDFGTGSGCLSIALAHHVAVAKVDAVDISPAALEVARQNAARHNLSARIQFYQGNGFEALPAGSRFELIVANPPYIPSSEIGQLAPEVREYDPHLALDGGPDGLRYLRQLAQEALAFLISGGALMCEFGEGQGETLRGIFQERGWLVEAIAPDLSGRARFLVARGAQS